MEINNLQTNLLKKFMQKKKKNKQKIDFIKKVIKFQKSVVKHMEKKYHFKNIIENYPEKAIKVN